MSEIGGKLARLVRNRWEISQVYMQMIKKRVLTSMLGPREGPGKTRELGLAWDKASQK